MPSLRALGLRCRQLGDSSKPLHKHPGLRSVWQQTGIARKFASQEAHAHAASGHLDEASPCRKLAKEEQHVKALLSKRALQAAQSTAIEVSTCFANLPSIPLRNFREYSEYMRTIVFALTFLCLQRSHTEQPPNITRTRARNKRPRAITHTRRRWRTPSPPAPGSPSTATRSAPPCSESPPAPRQPPSSRASRRPRRDTLQAAAAIMETHGSSARARIVSDDDAATDPPHDDSSGRTWAARGPRRATGRARALFPRGFPRAFRVVRCPRSPRRQPTHHTG